MPEQLGVVTGGSFLDGLTVRLAAGHSTEALQVGHFVVVDGDQHRYFSTIADLQLRLTDPALAADPAPAGSPFLRAALAGVQTYAEAVIKPSLMLEDKANVTGDKPKPVRTIPMHFATLSEAAGEDFDVVFGAENLKEGKFALGTPLTMEQPIPLDLARLVERSNGVFGQSGTGKSVLTRLLLCGVIKAGLASTLIFDMHSEYAWQKEGEGGAQLRGLREMFGSRVGVFSLDQRDATRQQLDATLQIGLNQIEPGDVELLAGELNLTPTFAATAHSLFSRYREDWLATLLDMDADGIKAFCEQSGAHEGAVTALKQKLALLDSRDYIVRRAATNVIDTLLGRIKKREHVILQFGRHGSLLDYMLVANVLTRRIHADYTEQVTKYDTTQSAADRPHPLMIVLEEAHKFLAPAVARQTIFGTIAREMRKYSVTLLVVDQRPSGIDAEILSQLGTKITGLLTEEHDIDAVLTGVAGRSHWRGVLASLETKQQCLVLGHAIPMPMVLRTRSYDHDFFTLMSGRAPASTLADLQARSRAANADLFGED
ncbi:MAG: ATP-binding protein [Thermomicrobiales bacterium]